MSRLWRQVRAEWRKVFTTRMVWGLLIGLVVWTAINVVAQILASSVGDANGAPPLDSAEGLRGVFASASSASVFALLLGVIAVTTEFRHGTATGTFMASPRRGRVLVAKAIALPVVTFLYGVVGVGVTVALAWPLLAWKHVTFDLQAGQLPHVLLGSLVVITLAGALGVGFGALVRNQVAAVTIALLWTLLVESLAVSLLPSVGKWLPGGASSALTYAQPLRGGELLTPPAAAALLVGYCVVLVVLAALTTMRRDIT